MINNPGRTSGSGTWDTSRTYGLATHLVHDAIACDATSGAILTPIVQSTTYIQESIEKYMDTGYSYLRTANPTVKTYEDKLAALEGGFGAAAFNTGMAATCTAISAFCKAGDHVLVTNCSYGGTNRACRVMFAKMGIEFTFIDMRDASSIKTHLKPNTRMLISETPANPTLTLIDIAAVSVICKEHSKQLIHMCDSTFATPVIEKPIELGADITLQSTTKYYDGHNISVGGALICATEELFQEVKLYQNILGNIMTPQVAFYQLQTCKTMELRVRQQSATAQAVAEMLEAHPKVERVAYPGLASFPQKELANRQHKDGLHGGMLWFEVKGGSDAGRRLMNTVCRPWALCENLGATESIITCPSVMTHANMLKEDRLKVGITDGFVRVSCGIETTKDLVDSLRVALDKL